MRLEHSLTFNGGHSAVLSFSYYLTRVEETDLVIHADENHNAPLFLKLGMLIDGSDYNNVLFTANARITAADVAGFGSEWRTDLSVGSIWGMSTELYKPLAPDTRWFVAPRAYANNSPFDLYDRSTRIADYRIHRYGGGFDLGYAINRSSELRVGYDIGYFESSLRIGQPILPSPSGRTGASSLRYDLDTLDSPVIPRRGVALQVRLQWTDASPGAQRGFPLADVYWAAVRPVSKPGIGIFAGLWWQHFRFQQYRVTPILSGRSGPAECLWYQRTAD